MGSEYPKMSRITFKTFANDKRETHAGVKAKPGVWLELIEMKKFDTGDYKYMARGKAFEALALTPRWGQCRKRIF